MDRSSRFLERPEEEEGTERHIQFEVLVHSNGITVCIPTQKRSTALMLEGTRGKDAIRVLHSLGLQPRQEHSCD